MGRKIFIKELITSKRGGARGGPIKVNKKYILTITDNKKSKSPITATEIVNNR
jgi:hypothetical protein